MHTRPAAYARIVEGDRILLAHWSGPAGSGWTLPGGGMEDGESAEQTAIREVLEETGLEIELGALLGVDVLYLAGAERPPGHPDDLRSLRIVHAARVTGGTLRAERDGSTDDVAWVPLAELATLDRVELVDRALAMSG